MSKRPLKSTYNYKPQTAKRPTKLEDLGSFDYDAFPNVKPINDFRADINGQEYLVFEVDGTWYKEPLNIEEQSYDTPDVNVFENQSGIDAINKNNNFNNPLNVGVDDYAPFNANELPTDESNLGLEQEGIGFLKEEGLAPTHLENIHEHNRNLTYTDNLSIKFMDNDLVEVFTEDNVDQQIVVQPDGREMLVETIADYPVGALDNFLIKEGDPQYEPGKRNWRIPIAAENYEPDPKNPLQTKVTLSRNSGIGDYIEDAIVEPVLQGIRATEPEVYKRLSDWADGQITKFRERLGIQLYGTNELISKLYTAQRLGHKSQDVMDVFEKTGLLLPSDLVDILDSIVTTSREGRTNIEVLKNGPDHINQIPASNKILETDAPEGKPVRYSIKDMKKEDRQRMVNSGRAGGFIGKDPVTWRHAAKEIEPYHEILDYGAGKNARQTKKYQAEGFNVNAWDLPENQATTLHDPQALRKRYDYVVASNVINVQPNISSVKNVLDEIYSVTNPGGKVVLNFPSSPRNSNLTPAGLEKMLNRIFEGVRKVDGTTSSPVFEARRRVKGVRKKEQVAEMLDKIVDIDYKNDLEVENYAVAQAMNDIVTLLEDPTFRLNDQLEWYGEEISDAMDIVSLEPGMQIIKEKPEYEMLFKTLLGITSQGIGPMAQFQWSVDLTKHFIKTDKFRYGKNTSGKTVLKAKNLENELNTVGVLAGGVVATQAKRIETLINEFGIQGAMDWMVTPITGYGIKDWSVSNGFSIPGHIKKNKSTLEKTYYGANMFGPKIGRYILGIYGFDSEAVYDQWWTSTWRRWLGKMFRVNKEGEFILDKKGEKIIRQSPEGQEIIIMDKVIDRVANALSKELNYPFTRMQIQALLWEYEKVLWENLGQKPELSVNYKNAAMIRAERLGYADEYATSQSLRDAIKAKVRNFYRTSEAVKSIEEGVKTGRVRNLLKKRYSFKVKSSTDVENVDPLESPIYYPQLQKVLPRLIEDNVSIPKNKFIKTLKDLGVSKLEISDLEIKDFIKENKGDTINLDDFQIHFDILANLSIESTITGETYKDWLKRMKKDWNLEESDIPVNVRESFSKIYTKVFMISSDNLLTKSRVTFSLHRTKKGEKIAILDGIESVAKDTQTMIDMLDGEVIATKKMQENTNNVSKISVKEYLRQATQAGADYVYVKNNLENANTNIIRDELFKYLGDKIVPEKEVEVDFKPRKLYHGTYAEFDNFNMEYGDIGLHFGTTRQALDRLSNLDTEGLIKKYPNRLIKVELNIKNPLRMKDIGGWNELEDFMETIENLDGVDVDALDFFNYEDYDLSFDGFRRFLIDQGYDGIVYRNDYEGVREDKDATASLLESDPEFYEGTTVQDESSKSDSYIAFDKSQITIIDELRDPLILKNTYTHPKKRFSMKISDDATPPPKEVYVDKTDSDLPTWKKDALTITRNNLNSIKKTGGFTKDLLETIDTRLKLIAPNLESKLRKFEMELGIQTNENLLKLANFKDKVLDKLSKEKRLQLELALVNADESMVIDVINDLPDQVSINAFQAIEDYREMLDEFHQRALNTGYDIGFRNYYFPRRVKDLDGLLTLLNKNNPRSSGVITQAIAEKERNLGRSLDDDERRGFISNMIRGFNVIAGKPGNLKDRRIEHIDMEMYKNYYEDFLTANEKYITGMVRTIKRQEFFGKGDDNVDDIGGAVARWMGQGQSPEEIDKSSMFKQPINKDDSLDMEEPIIPPNITPDEQQQIIDILRARFNFRAAHGFVSPMKNVLYAMTMGKITSAMQQFGDTAWSFHSAGFTPTIKAILQTLVRKNILTKEDLGIERIAAEFNRVDKTGKALDFIFKAVGLDAMDRLGKETLVQAEYDKMRKQAKIISTGKSSFVLDEQKKRNFYVKLLQTFESEQVADQVIKDLSEDKMTEDIKFLMFCRLCDVQPVTQSQVPVKYLDSPNGRIGYQLKTFTLKQFDNYRRTGTIRMSNGLSLMDEGRKQKEEGEKTNNKTKIEDGKRLIREGRKEYASAFGSLVRLLAIFFATDTAANVAKDYVMGREVDLEDYVVDGIFRLFGFSRYIIYTGKREGYGRALLEQFIPFGLFISLEGKAERDLTKLYKVWKGEKEWSETYFETPNIVPVADWVTLGLNAFDKIAGTDTAKEVPLGKTYYWWYGGGKKKQLERNIKTIADASKEGLKTYDTYEKVLDAERHLNRDLADLQSMHVLDDADRKSTIKSFYNNILKELKDRKSGLQGEDANVYTDDELNTLTQVLQRMVSIGLKSRDNARKTYKDILSKYVPSQKEKEQKRQEEGLKFKELYEEAN